MENAALPDAASFASLDELSALLEVFGLPVAEELARRSAKPLQVSPVPLPASSSSRLVADNKSGELDCAC